MTEEGIEDRVFKCSRCGKSLSLVGVIGWCPPGEDEERTYCFDCARGEVPMFHMLSLLLDAIDNDAGDCYR